jgi:phosphinothricin acetyltransferase
MGILLDTMSESDWPAVRAIYRQGIDTGHATFETHPPKTWEAWYKSRIASCCLVARAGEAALGWAALTPVSSRCVYAGVAEVSIYIAGTARGCGVGSLLLGELIRCSETNGLWMLQAGIFPENDASIHLHKKHGFRQVGLRERLGKMSFGPCQGQWRDVMLLERRSQVVGID